MKSITEEGTQATYYGPSRIIQDHYAVYPDWKNDIPVPSRNYTVGQLDIEPGLLGKVNQELAQLEEYCTATPYCDEDTMGIMELEFPEQVPPFFTGFSKRVCSSLESCRGARY